MGMYNILEVEMNCPRCGERAELHVDCHFGYTGEMQRLTVGDVYPWRSGRAPQNGGRPVGGSADGHAYATCPRCAKDFFALVVIWADEIVDVLPDEGWLPYISDGLLLTRTFCPHCGTDQDVEIGLYDGHQERSYRLGDQYDFSPMRGADGATELRGRAYCPSHARADHVFWVRLVFAHRRFEAVQLDPVQEDFEAGHLEQILKNK